MRYDKALLIKHRICFENEEEKKFVKRKKKIEKGGDKENKNPEIYKNANEKKKLKGF